MLLCMLPWAEDVFESQVLKSRSCQHPSQRILVALRKLCEVNSCSVVVQVLEHDLPQSLLDGVLKVSREFFELPLREKQKFTPSYGRQSVDSEHAVLDWSDLMFHRDLDTDVGWPTQPSVYRYMIR